MNPTKTIHPRLHVDGRTLNNQEVKLIITNSNDIDTEYNSRVVWLNHDDIDRFIEWYSGVQHRISMRFFPSKESKAQLVIRRTDNGIYFIKSGSKYLYVKKRIVRNLLWTLQVMRRYNIEKALEDAVGL